MRTLILALACFLSFNMAYAQTWGKLGAGTNGLNGYGNYTGPMCVDKAGNVYIGGWFNDMLIDTTWDWFHSHIYKWNGTSWNRLGTSSDAFYGEAIALCTDTAGNLYAAGDFYNDSGHYYVAKWDGTSWSELGGFGGLRANSDILSICIDKMGYIYAAGVFTDDSSSYSGHPYVAKWDGTSWSPLGAGSSALNANHAINIICADTFGNIYAAGTFTDGSTAFTGNLYVAKWNGASWSELGSGVIPADIHANSEIYSLIADNSGNVYAAGYFLPSISRQYVAKWDGTSWSEVGAGSHAINANNAIISLCIDKYDNLYAAGDFTDTTRTLVVYSGNGDSDFVHPCYVSKWDGATWSELGGSGAGALNANNWIQSICTDTNGNIYAAGLFTDTTVTLSFIDTVLLPGGGSGPVTVHYHPFYVAKYDNPLLSISPLHRYSSVDVYPNPAYSTVNISLSTTELVGTDYALYDYAGRIHGIGKLSSSVTSIDIMPLGIGTYFLKLTNGAVYKIQKG